MRNHHQWLYQSLCGLLIGIACILPGASGGVLAVSFGLYRPMLDAVTHLLKEPRKHLRFLLTLGASIAGGILLGAVVLSEAMARHERLTLFLFTGLILGGVPDLLEEARKGGHFRLSWLLALLLGAMLALPLCTLGGSGRSIEQLSTMQALATGILEGIGTVVPGVSTSFVLIRLGWYQAYLSAVSGMSAGQIVPIALGFGASALVCVRLVQRLFDRHTGYAYYAVLGFLLISAAVVFPGFTLERETWAQLAALIFGLTAVRLTGQLKTYEG